MRFIQSAIVGTILLAAANSEGKNPLQPVTGNGVAWSVEAFNRSGGSPQVLIGFDDLPCDASLDGLTICGVTFQMVNAPLMVVCAADTFTPHGFHSADHAERLMLHATSGHMLLSPGGAILGPGPDPAVEDDDIVMIFNPSVACVGFDHISQYADGMSYTQVTVIADDGSVLHQGTIDIGTGRRLFAHGEQRMIGTDQPELDGPERTMDFWGYVSSSRNIREVRIDETDDNDVCPDSNIGIDTLRFAPCATSCGSADLTGDGRVDSSDVQRLLSEFGPADPLSGGRVQWSSTDLNRDGVVDTADLVELLSHAS